MMKHVITLALLVIFAVTAIAQDDTDPNETIIHIAPMLQSCTGVAPQDCMIVRFEDEDELSFFYDSIEGFTFEEGFEYTLLVNITERDNVPADASSLQYELVEVLQQFPASISDKVWELQSLNEENIKAPSQYTLLVTEDGVVLKADCNTVQANLTLNPFDIETTTSTKVMCPPESLDSEYLEALNAATMMSVENGELIIQSTEGQLRFAPPRIDGIEWTLTRVVGIAMMFEFDDSVAYTLHINDTEASMQFACNSGGGTVDFDGGVLRFTGVISTLMACSDDPLAGMFPPENAVYSINADGHLVLEDDMGNLYEFTRAEAE